MDMQFPARWWNFIPTCWSYLQDIVGETQLECGNHQQHQHIVGNHGVHLCVYVLVKTSLFPHLALALWFSNQLLELATIDRPASQGKITLSSGTCCGDTPNNYTFVHINICDTSTVSCCENIEYNGCSMKEYPQNFHKGMQNFGKSKFNNNAANRSKNVDFRDFFFFLKRNPQCKKYAMYSTSY